jgi:manganese oxidase
MNVYFQAGGPYRMPGDYLYMNHRMAYMEAGQWGFLRVRPPDDRGILSLRGARTQLRKVGLDTQE